MYKYFLGLEKALMVFLLIGMTIVTFVQVVARYVFHSGVVWALELTVFMFAWLVLLGAAQLAREGRHIGIDALTSSLGRGGRKISGLIATGACIVYAILMLSGSWTYFSKFYSLNIPAADLPIPTWVALIVLPVAFAILLLRFSAWFWRILTGRADSMLSAIEDKELVEELNAAQSGSDGLSDPATERKDA